MKDRRAEEIDLWACERLLHSQGTALVCGVDEAGRGPLAGPVCAGAVILPEGCDLPGLNDSKKLTEKRREALFPLIQEREEGLPSPGRWPSPRWRR